MDDIFSPMENDNIFSPMENDNNKDDYDIAGNKKYDFSEETSEFLNDTLTYSLSGIDLENSDDVNTVNSNSYNINFEDSDNIVDSNSSDIDIVSISSGKRFLN